jgi:hypothetical protein
MRGLYPRALSPQRQTPHPSTMLRIASTLSRKGRGKVRGYTEPVVTPPSTTMVCPVMKLDASEPR